MGIFCENKAIQICSELLKLLLLIFGTVVNSCKHLIKLFSLHILSLNFCRTVSSIGTLDLLLRIFWSSSLRVGFSEAHLLFHVGHDIVLA